MIFFCHFFRDPKYIRTIVIVFDRFFYEKIMFNYLKDRLKKISNLSEVSTQELYKQTLKCLVLLEELMRMMQGLGNNNYTRESLLQKIQQIRKSSKFIDEALDAEINHLHTILTNESLDAISEDTTTCLEQIAFLIEQLNFRIQRRQKAAKKGESTTNLDRVVNDTTKLSSRNFIKCLKQSGRVDAQHLATELEELILLLTELRDNKFQGDRAERISNNAQELQEELLGIKNRELDSYWRVLLDFGAERLVRSVERDKSGKDLRKQIEEGMIDLDEIVETVRRLTQRAESIASQQIIVDLERALNEGELEYIIPREKRDREDPFIVRLSKYIDPNVVLSSRYVISYEKDLRTKSLNLMKGILTTIDEIENFIGLIKAQDAGGIIELRMKKFQDLMNYIIEITDSIQVVDYKDDSETETAYLCLLLRSYTLCELRDRLTVLYSKLLKDTSSKFLVAFLNRKVLQYTKEIIKYTKHENMRALQKGIKELRNASQVVGARFSLEQEMTPFIETLQQEIMILVDALLPDYPFLFPQGVPKVLKDFIGFDNSLKKYANKIRKILTKEETPENAWRKLLTQLEELSKKIQSL